MDFSSKNKGGARVFFTTGGCLQNLHKRKVEKFVCPWYNINIL